MSNLKNVLVLQEPHYLEFPESAFGVDRVLENALDLFDGYVLALFGFCKVLSSHDDSVGSVADQLDDLVVGWDFEGFTLDVPQFEGWLFETGTQFFDDVRGRFFCIVHRRSQT